MQIGRRKILTAIGMMSGTSMDGIDVALIRTDGDRFVERGLFRAYAYPAAFRKQLELANKLARSIKDRDDRPGKLADIETELTERHAQAISDFLKFSDVDHKSVDCIGFHGQTLLHRPEEALTVQIGSGQVLADRAGIPVVSDMRANDMRNGGQGAPLVPVYHRALASQLVDAEKANAPIAFVNIGGIANITWVGADSQLIAFDTGPGNALIDQWMQQVAGIPFDDGGRIGSEGGIIRTIADRYMASDYFAHPAPKSLDRADFPALDPHEAELADGARTLANVTAESIVRACDHLPEPPSAWIVCGGGRRNQMIMRDLKEAVAKIGNAKVIGSEELGLNGDAMEAEAWGYLAVRSLKGLALTFPGTTGCREPITGGILASPSRTK